MIESDKKCRCLNHQHRCTSIILVEVLLLKLPKHQIAAAHAKLFRINENIVPHLLQAVKKLQYDKGFYPTLDCDFLVEILTTDIALKLVLPKMLTLTRQSSLESKKSDKSITFTSGTDPPQ